jgi:hypothetical protein
MATKCGRIGSISKSGVYFFQDLPTARDPSGNLISALVKVAGDDSLGLDKGIYSMTMPTTQMGAAGLAGGGGGA